MSNNPYYSKKEVIKQQIADYKRILKSLKEELEKENNIQQPDSSLFEGKYFKQCKKISTEYVELKYIFINKVFTKIQGNRIPDYYCETTHITIDTCHNTSIFFNDDDYSLDFIINNTTEELNPIMISKLNDILSSSNNFKTYVTHLYNI